MSNLGDKLPLDLRYPTERIGQQLGQAIAPMVDDLGDALGTFAAWRDGDFQHAVEIHHRLAAYEDARVAVDMAKPGAERAKIRCHKCGQWIDMGAYCGCSASG